MKKRSDTKRPPAPPPAPARAPTYDDLLAIARLIESGSRFSEFRLRSGDIEVEVKRADGASVAPAAGRPPAESPPAAAPPPAATAPTPPARPVPRAAASPAEVPAGHEVVRSPMVGTFYRSPQPGAPPFVEVGTKVKPDTIVCIIEVMKLMNSIAAGVPGVVTHVLAENGATVEPGQPLVAIRPDR